MYYTKAVEFIITVLCLSMPFGVAVAFVSA